MKFLIDAQLPPTLKHFFLHRGHDAIHTLDLPLQNSTPDQEVRRVSFAENRIVITKDADFYYSFVLNRQPPKLVLVKTGNLGTKALISVFANQVDELLRLLQDHDFVVVMADKLSLQKE